MTGYPAILFPVGTSQPVFNAPLTTSIAPLRSLGSPTFTRATTASVHDWELKVNKTLSGEARFRGARRVKNSVDTSSYDLTISAYVKRSGHAVSAPDSTGLCPITVTGGGAGNQGIYNESANTDPAGTYVWRARAIAGSISSLAICIKDRATDTIRASGTVTIAGGSGSVISISSSGVTTAGCRVEINGGVGAANGTFWIGEWQVECVNGQSNQNPSEYVSVGVLSAPYHGANVDGVKCFDYQNGNTVSSNVVTEAKGAAISSSTLLGYVSEEQRTNLCLQSETLDNASWTKNASTVSANAITGPDGNTTADKIAEDNTNAVHGVLQSFTKAASSLAYTASVYLKQGERTLAFIGLDDGTNSSRAFFNLATGALGTTATGGAGFAVTGSSIQPAANGFYRCTLSITSSTSTTLRLLIDPTSADGTTSYAGTTGSGIYAWGAQLEQAAFATSYIPTTTASVTRNADALQYSGTGVVNTAVGTAYCEVTVSALALGPINPRIIGNTATDASSPITALSSSGRISCYDGTNSISMPSGTIIDGLPHKVAGRWGAAGITTALDGTTNTSASFDGDMLTAGITIGYGVGAGTFSGAIRNVKIWPYALTDNALTALTT